MAHLYLRVKDPDTGHEFDLPANHPHITKGLVHLVKAAQYPPAAVMRRPKHHVKLARRSAREPVAPPEVTAEVTDKENTHD